jgi:hypothetical protein
MAPHGRRLEANVGAGGLCVNPCDEGREAVPPPRGKRLLVARKRLLAASRQLLMARKRLLTARRGSP